MKLGFFALAGAAALGGCILPVSTGAPLPATTVGKGNVGFAISAEAPTLDLMIADNGDQNMTGSPSAINYGAAPAVAATMTLSYALGDDTDIEVAGEGALYFFIFPLPTGGSIGVRQHIDAGDSLDFAIAGKIGYVSSSAEITTSTSGTQESSAAANYGALQLVLQGKRGVVRRLRTFQGIPGFSYTWVTLSVPIGCALMLITAILKIKTFLRAISTGEPIAKREEIVSGEII